MSFYDFDAWRQRLIATVKGTLDGMIAQSPLIVRQEFHGPIGAVAGRDINIQITFTEVLNKLAESVEADQKISLEEKRSLIFRFLGAKMVGKTRG